MRAGALLAPELTQLLEVRLAQPLERADARAKQARLRGRRCLYLRELRQELRVLLL